MSLNAQIGKRAESRRKSMGWTATALAEKIGVSDSYIGLLERGKSRWNADTIERVSAELGVSPAWLMGGSTDSNISLTGLVQAVQRRDPAGIGRALATLMAAIPPAADDYDPTFERLSAAYRSRDWYAMMTILIQLRVDWGLDPGRKPKI